MLVEQVRLVWKHRMLIAAVAAGTVALVALWTLRQPRIYEAVVSIEMDPNPARPLGSQVQEVSEFSGGGYFQTRDYQVTQLHIIASQHVAEAVVRQLGLQHDADFLQVPSSRRRAFQSVSVENAALELRSRIRAEAVKESRLVEIHVEDPSPRRSQLIANTIAAVFIRQNLENKLSATVSALEWLGQQLETLRNQLEASEMALHEYRRQNNLLAVTYEDRRNHVTNRIEHLSNGLTEAQVHQMALSARVRELRRAAASRDPLVEQAPELLASPVLQQLRQDHEQALRARETLLARYGEHAQQMEANSGALHELEAAIRREVQNILGSAEAELRTASRVEADLRVALTEAQREGMELNLREIAYGRLLRERENNSKLYGIVLERTKETDLTRLIRVNNMRILDEALVPNHPSKPRVLLSLILGVFGGLLLGIGAAVVVIQSDRSVRSQADIEETLHATFLGIVPKIRTGIGALRYQYAYGYGTEHRSNRPVSNPDLIVHTHPTSAVAEACRVIRTNLLFMSPDKPLQTLMVSSASAREGKTTVAVSLAITMAQSGKRVLLVDTDLRRPRIHKVFDIRPPIGITSVLVNEATLDEAVSETAIPNLFLLPCGPIPPNPAELLHSHRFRELLETARAKFDRVVFDTPPVGLVTDALVIASQVDGAVLVVRARSTLRARAIAILAQMRAINGRVAGVVLNDVDLEKDGSTSYYYAGQYKYSSSREAA